jgi:hypothetical protein
MAKSNGGDGSADSWPGFLSELTKSFLILRDIFGYALPGAVFFSIGLLCRRFSLGEVQQLLRPYQLPVWLALAVGLGACYTVGHLMAQLAYFFFNTWKFPALRRKAGPEAPDASKTIAHTQVPAELIRLREDHPALLTELDRQTIMTQLRGSTGAAMVVGCLVFYAFPTPPIGVMAGAAGVFLLIVFWFSAIPHLDDLTRRTIDAGITVEAAEKAKPVNGTAQLKQLLQALIAAAQDALQKL